MSLKQALSFAKNASEEKVPFRFQFPIQTKKEFEALCDKHGVSMTDMIMGLIQSSIDEDKGITEVATLNIIHKIEDLKEKNKELWRVYNDVGDESIELANGEIINFTYEIDSNALSIDALNAELKKRSKQ